MSKKRTSTVKQQASAKINTNSKKPATPDCDLPVAQKPARFRYQATAKLTKELVNGMGTQPKLIAGELVRAKRPLSHAELTEAVSGKLATRQEPKRVVSFYLIQWRNLGLVKRV